MALTYMTSIATGAGLSAVVLFVTVAGWISWRTRSTHVLANRAWRWFTDREEVADLRIRAFVQEQNDLMSFSFVSGLSAVSAEEAHRLIDTLRRVGVDVADVRAARGHIRKVPSGIRVKPVPHRATVAVEFILTGLMVWIGLVSALGIASNAVFVKFERGEWLSLEGARAKPFWSRGAALTPTQCGGESFSASLRMTMIDVENVCAAWKDPRIGEFIASTLRDQRGAFGALAAISFFVALLLGWDVRVGRAARRVHEALAAHGEVADAEDGREQGGEVPVSDKPC